MIAVLLRAVLLRAVSCTVLYYGISHNNNSNKNNIIEHIWSFCHGVLDAFFVGKASRCDGRWGIPSSNWIIDEEEATGVTNFVDNIIIINNNIAIIFIVVVIV